VWHPAPNELPSTGHGCFIALIGAPGRDDMPPLLPDASSPGWSEFLTWVGASNNIAWRNFNVFGLVADGAGLMGQADLVIQGMPDLPLIFDLVLEIEAKSDVEVQWDIPPLLHMELARSLWCVRARHSHVMAEMHATATTAQLMVRGAASVHFEGVRISRAPHHCRLMVRLPAPESPFVQIAVRQLHEGKEVGRLTLQWRLADR
jgi:hypothetical protein